MRFEAALVGGLSDCVCFRALPLQFPKTALRSNESGAQRRVISLNQENEPSIGAFAIVPSNDVAAALPFWERLGFERSGGEGKYIIMRGWGCEVHLTQAGSGAWRVNEKNNPFGVFIRTPAVGEIAALAADTVIRPGGILRHREWGMYEVGIEGPDGLLVRVGWPSHLVEQAP